MMQTGSQRSQTIPPENPGAFNAVTSCEEVFDAFVGIICADDEWLRREFEEVVAAGWGGGTPSGPPQKCSGAVRPEPHRPLQPTLCESYLRNELDGVRSLQSLHQRPPPVAS